MMIDVIRNWMKSQAPLLALAFLLCFVSTARAENAFRITITGVGASQIPLVIAPFRDEGKFSESVSAIVQADLERSGLFKFARHEKHELDDNSIPVFSDWRKLDADALITGSMRRLPDGRVQVRYRLWDVLKGVDQGGQNLLIRDPDIRLAAHRIADAIYEKLTGDKGAFATRMAFVSKIKGTYHLSVADADGQGAQRALSSKSPIISPAWSPDGRRVAYVTFESRKAVVVVQDILSGKREVIANFRGTNSAPAWSPDGRQLVVTLSQSGGSQLYLIGFDGKIIRRLTSSDAIDTEATWSPDGKSIYFVSDRGGSPQIYRTSVEGGAPQRVTFSGQYNISPDISPDGKWMAYVSQVAGAYRVHVMDLVTGQVRAVSDTRDDESPSFAPNSRWLVYATRSEGKDVLVTTTVEGRLKVTLDTGASDIREPVWGPFLTPLTATSAP